MAPVQPNLAATTINALEEHFPTPAEQLYSMGYTPNGYLGLSTPQDAALAKLRAASVDADSKAYDANLAAGHAKLKAKRASLRADQARKEFKDYMSNTEGGFTGWGSVPIGDEGRSPTGVPSPDSSDDGDQDAGFESDGDADGTRIKDESEEGAGSQDDIPDQANLEPKSTKGNDYAQPNPSRKDSTTTTKATTRSSTRSKANTGAKTTAKSKTVHESPPS